MTDRILVTGATGFVGSHLLGALADEHDVIAGTRYAGHESTGVRWVPCDLSAAEPAEGLPPDVDTVIYLAQSRRFREFPQGVPDMLAVNVNGVAKLLEWAARSGARRFIYASSGGISARGSTGGPLDFYLQSKRAAELLVDSYRDRLVTVTLRLFFVYGSGQPASMLLPRLVGNVIAGRAIQLQGAGGLVCNPVHVSDAVRAFVAATSLDEGQRLLIGGPEVADLRHIGTIIGELVGRDPVFEVDEGAEPERLVADTGPMESALGRPTVHLRAGLEELCASLAARPDR